MGLSNIWRGEAKVVVVTTCNVLVVIMLVCVGCRMIRTCLHQMRKEYGVQTLSKVSRKLCQSIRRVVDGKLFFRTKGRCMVSRKTEPSRRLLLCVVVVAVCSFIRRR